MPWLVPSVIATMTGTIALTICYFYLYLQDKQRYLKFWAISWAIYTTRHVFMLVMLLWQKHHFLLIANQLSTLISGVLLLYGSYLFINRRFPRIFFVIVLLGGIWIIFSILNNLSFLIMSLPTFSFLAIIYIWTGYIFLQYSKKKQKEASVVGYSFIFWGFHKANYPFLRPVIWFAPWGYLIAAALEFISALGLLLVYFRKTKDELTQNKERLENILKMLPMPTLITDANHKIKFINEKFIEKLKYSRSDISELERWWLSVFSAPQNKENVQSSSLTATENANQGNNQVDMLECELIAKDGQRRICELYAIPFEKDQIIIINDITENRTVSLELQENKKRLEYAQSIAKVGDWGWDLETNQLEWSDQTYRIFERDPESFEVTVESFEKAIHPDDFQDFVNERELALKENRDVNIEHRIVLPDNREKWVHEISSITKDEKGDVIKVFGTVQDITDRKEDEERCHAIFESTNDGLVIADINKKFIHCNTKFRRLLGYSLAEIENLGVQDIHPKEDLPMIVETFNKMLSGKIQLGKNLPVKRKDGSVFYADITSSTITLGGERYIMGAFRDVTEVFEIEKEKFELEKKIIQNQKMESIGTLAGGIAHDFNNILSSILGFSDLALGQVEEGSMIEEDLKEIQKGGLRAKELVHQILTFARQTDETLIPIDLGPIIKEVLKFIRSSTPTNIEISYSIDCTFRIMGNPTQVHQIVMNICSNAAQAMIDGGKLTIDVTNAELDSEIVITDNTIMPGKYVKFEISDTGTGIPESVKKQIFEPYYTTKKPGEGTGLGLAVVLGIVESYKGHIFVESSPGKGSVFIIYIPATENKDYHIEKSDRKPLTGNEKILFVDDELTIVKLYQKHLSRLGYKVTATSSSKDALDLIKAEPDRFDLVISDITMPNMTGDQLAKQILTITDLPIILCTGYSSRVDLENFKETGIKDLLIKPVAIYDMANSIRAIVDNKSE